MRRAAASGRAGDPCRDGIGLDAKSDPGSVPFGSAWRKQRKLPTTSPTQCDVRPAEFQVPQCRPTKHTGQPAGSPVRIVTWTCPPPSLRTTGFALNLDKLDRVWQRMEELLPNGPFIGTGSDDDVIYAQLGEQWTTISSSLPAIDGWKLEAEIVGYAAIGQARLEYLELDEPEGLRAFDAHAAAPGTEAFRYRQKLARARQQLVRTRCENLVRSVDELLIAVPADIDQELPKEQANPILYEIKQAVDELERLLGEALEGGPRQGDLHRHLHFAEPHDLR